MADDGVSVLVDGRLLVPELARSAVLTALHRGHVGQQAMLALARSVCWWPGMAAGGAGEGGELRGLREVGGLQAVAPRGRRRRCQRGRFRYAAATTSSSAASATSSTWTASATSWTSGWCRPRRRRPPSRCSASGSRSLERPRCSGPTEARLTIVPSSRRCAPRLMFA